MMDDIEEIKKDILNSVGELTFVHGLGESSDKVKYGDFVVSGLTTTGERIIGYVVQVREKWGAFGSDMFLIREHDERLMTHENQSFWKLSIEQVKSIKPFFKATPEKELKENPTLEYSIKKKLPKEGFIVGPQDAPDRVDSCSFTITTTKAGEIRP